MNRHVNARMNSLFRGRSIRLSYNADWSNRGKPVAKVKFERLDCPACYFAGWSYDIKPAHYAALGVQWRSGAFGEKYQALAAAIDYGFLPGDLFFLRNKPEFLQVVAVLPEGLEVHVGAMGRASERKAFKTTPADFASWLLLGCRPAAAKTIPRGLSSGGLFAWSLPA